MVQNTKRYLVTEAQLYALKENTLLEGDSEFTKGDYVELLEPVEGYIVPPNTIGTVLHVDAVGTVRTQFSIDGQEVVIPINPDVDRIVKAYSASGSLQEERRLKKS